MKKIGFDNDKYLKMQSEHIRERISKFDNKLYLEFGGKLFDDYHASRVLPGFEPDSKLRMLMQLSDQAEIVIVISAPDIEKKTTFLVYYSFPVKKSIYLIWKCKFFCIFFLKNSEGFHNIAVDLSGFSLYNKKDNKEERNG